MNKTLFYAFFATTIFGAIAGYRAYTAQTDIILWDLHDVVLKRTGTFSTVMSYPHKAKALSNSNLRGKMVKILCKNTFKEGSSEEYIHMARQYNNPYLEEIIVKASNAQTPIPGTAAIINELHTAGYEQHVGSNIGKTAFEAIINPTEYPHCACVFRCMNIEKSHVVEYNDGDIIKKPNPDFFTQYLRKNNIDTNKTRVFFIDDKKENIEAANNLGLYGIQFKNPEQLREDLAAHGVSLKTA